jgi:hypothetical protein
MVIPALAVLASSFSGAATPPLRLVEAKKAFAVPMFHPPSATSPSDGLRRLQVRLPTSGMEQSLKCHIIVIEPPPGMDPKMVVEAPAIDPKIVRRSVCAEPSKD